MITGIYEIEEKIWNNLTKQKYAVNNLLVLGFKNEKTIIYEGAKYEHCIGLSVDPRRGVMEIGRKGITVSVPISKNPDKVNIKTEKTDIVVTIY